MKLSANKKIGKREKTRRILALVIAAVMVLSVFGTLIYNLSLSTWAADETTAVSTDTAAGVKADSKKVRIGLMYGNNVTVGFEVTAENGFQIVTIDRLADEYPQYPLWNTNLTKVAAIVDGNLSKTEMTYSKTAKESNTVVGGWHIELDFGNGISYPDQRENISESLLSDRLALETDIEILSPILSEIGFYCIPSYIDSRYVLRIGVFPNEKQAAEAKDTFIKLLDFYFSESETDTDTSVLDLSKLTVGIAAPTDTAVSLIDPETDTLLFEYDDRDLSGFGLTPVPNADGSESSLVTPAKKLYAGSFMFRRSNPITCTAVNEDTDGVSLTDILTLGDYIKGVLPYEISNTWPFESQKAFAITVRSFTLSSLNRHQLTYGFDLCNTTHCQVYSGKSKINDMVIRAVEETDGLVMTYEGEIVQAFYSAVTGGVTVSSKDVWGGDLPYLKAIETPWEIFTNHTYGQWNYEATPTDLYSQLRSAGYTNLKGRIASISIDELAENSTYVKQITFTDIYGNTATIKSCQSVYLALQKYVKSANFVVGQGEVTANIVSFDTDSLTQASVLTASGTKTLTNRSAQTVMTADGIQDAASGIHQNEVLTADGETVLGEPVSHSEPTVLKASSSSNFIFAGKGWGHGVGLSQVGLRDLANMGYEATEILHKYMPDITITDFRNVK